MDLPHGVRHMAKKTNPPASKPVTTDLVVNYHSRSWVTRERDPDDEWDRDNTASEHTLESISIADGYGYSTITYPGEVTPGEKVYLVYAVYSTGDSFGHDDAARVELISVHKNLDVARWNLQRVQGSSGDDYTSKLVLSQDNGQTWTINPPWCGYFESLDYARVAGFTVLPAGASSNVNSAENWYEDIS